MFLQFQIKNNRPKEDVTIWLEGERNKLTSEEHTYYNGNTTFTYAVVLKKGQESVKLTLGKGDYELTELCGFLGDWGEKESRERGGGLYQSIFEWDKEKTQGNRIAGSVDAKKKGYFITSIPYDSGYEICIDGQKTDYEKVNTAFLGFPIAQGKHEVEMIYHAPGLKTGKYVSAAGFVMFFILLFTEKGRREQIAVL